MLVITVFLLLQTVNTEAQVLQALFKTEKNSVLFDGAPIFDKRSDSLITCSQLCTRDKRCKSANFIENQRTCSLLDKTRKTHPQGFLKQANVIHLEKVDAEPGSTQELAIPSCKALSLAIHPSGVYWIDPDSGSYSNAFKAYCEMETDGGGWTLVWSYAFTHYEDFSAAGNAVTPRPSWPAHPRVDVPISTTPPLDENDYNAIEFSQWKQFGKEVLIKNNINNWLVCSPGKGSLVEWQDGDVICKIVRRVTDTCPAVPPPLNFRGAGFCGPAFLGPAGGSQYYHFDGCTQEKMPAHDPCAKGKDNGLKNIENPHGNIFIR